MARKSISDKLRFEIFKRDSFRCQYCGAAAPDVLLEIDHVHPVADGGTNDLLNLVTACDKCNSGKGKRKLSDRSVLEQQRDQLAELNERRQQLEMMIRWKEELAGLRQETLGRLADHWAKVVPGSHLNETDQRALAKLTRHYPPDEIIDAMDTAAAEYLEFAENTPTQESVGRAWDKVGAICRVSRLAAKRPHVRQLYLIRGILRKRGCVNERRVMPLLEGAASAGLDLEQVRELANCSRSWRQFRKTLESWNDRVEKGTAETQGDA